MSGGTSLPVMATRGASRSASGAADGGGAWVTASRFSHHSVGPDALALRPRSALLTCCSVSDLGDVLARTQAHQLVVDLRDVELQFGAVEALAALDRWLREHRSGSLTVRLNRADQVIAFGGNCRMLIG